MNGELIKRQDRWDLYAEDGSKIGSSAPNPMNKLSLKNCQAIEDGYDLDDLADSYGVETEIKSGRKVFDEDFIAGFETALQILGNKKFTEEQVRILIYNERNVGLKPKDLIDIFLKNEWDVEILTEKVYDGLDEMAQPQYSNQPKLDVDGCLILKRK